MIDQKNILIGTVLAVVLVVVLGMLIPLIGGVIALIVAGIVVGYLVNQSVKMGAIHGALIGLFTGIIYVIIIYAVSGFSQKIIGGLIIYSLGFIPVYILLGLGGGIIGYVIKARQHPETLSEEEIPEEITSKDNDDEL
ncbi:DUF5518 domain-containing protein [Methanobacterium formicicum]|uniref:DUF5518 domain-containing protein n=1 Tax=Methanobacterium formicicum (strain DSM 3637 / PP1) TaxID=1204725 RepID=K2RWA4_METFP|nr:DUF5518 domain-containing protein [Methanobacterium formicicum]EKF87050.1 hypothetical protein A994_02160 [Methanobacterium formicicum DSM 3637]